MTKSIDTNNEELKAILKKYGLCKCGRHKDSPNFAYHVCIEQGLLYDITSRNQQIALAARIDEAKQLTDLVEQEIEYWSEQSMNIEITGYGAIDIVSSAVKRRIATLKAQEKS